MPRKEFLCSYQAINVPVGIIENMAYFTPEELPKYYLFGKKEKNLAEDLGVPFLEYLLYNPYEAGDYRPAAMQTSAVENILMKLLVML
jgi:ATP-binding protein involved in chromosome partitioning